MCAYRIFAPSYRMLKLLSSTRSMVAKQLWQAAGVSVCVFVHVFDNLRIGSISTVLRGRQQVDLGTSGMASYAYSANSRRLSCVRLPLSSIGHVRSISRISVSCEVVEAASSTVVFVVPCSPVGIVCAYGSHKIALSESGCNQSQPSQWLLCCLSLFA